MIWKTFLVDMSSLLVILVLVTGCNSHEPKPVATTKGSYPPKAPGFGYEVGNVAASEAKLRDLYKNCLTDGFYDIPKYGSEPLMLDDRKYAEFPMTRKDSTCTIRPFRKGTPPYDGQVIADTDIYYYHNFMPKHDGKDGMSMKPSGFYLVLYTNGEVKRVPPEDVRFISGQIIYPWMKEWKADLPKLPELDPQHFAEGVTKMMGTKRRP